MNYDLHNVLGFYAASITIILAITGLGIDFDWMDKGIYKTANLGKSYAAETQVLNLIRSSKLSLKINRLLIMLF